MTPEQLDEIEKLAAAATPGPWSRVAWRYDDEFGSSHPYTGELVSESKTICAWDIDGAPSPANAKFIARARSIVPELVASLREAREALDEREGDMHDRIRAGYDKTVADSWRAYCAKIEKKHNEDLLALEKAMDASADGSWMARALDAERERDEARAEVERVTHNLVQTERHAQLVEKSLAASQAEIERLRDIVAVNDERLATLYDEKQREVERLREAVRQVHALAEKTMLDAWCVGIGRETLRDIHKITKGMVE